MNQGSFNNYVNKQRWIGGQFIVDAYKANDPTFGLVLWALDSEIQGWVVPYLGYKPKPKGG